MRAAWGTLVTVGALVVMASISGTMVSDYLDSHGTFLISSGCEANMAMATVGRMRSLIEQLQVR